MIRPAGQTLTEDSPEIASRYSNFPGLTSQAAPTIACPIPGFEPLCRATAVRPRNPAEVRSHQHPIWRGSHRKISACGHSIPTHADRPLPAAVASSRSWIRRTGRPRPPHDSPCHELLGGVQRSIAGACPYWGLAPSTHGALRFPRTIIRYGQTRPAFTRARERGLRPDQPARQPSRSALW